jgi:hypothetical protein
VLLQLLGAVLFKALLHKAGLLRKYWRDGNATFIGVRGGLPFNNRQGMASLELKIRSGGGCQLDQLDSFTSSSRSRCTKLSTKVLV